MEHIGYIRLLILSLLLIIGFPFSDTNNNSKKDMFVSYIVDTKTQDIAFYWKNDTGGNIQTFNNLIIYLESKDKELVFAVNGGMFTHDYSPKGLYIEQNQTFNPLDTASGKGNFYLKPNGVFYITTDNLPSICTTMDFVDNGNIKYATQSGPMLLVDGKIHPAFKRGSKNLNIRNGVGILPDNKVLFAMSKEKINFYDFAEYFQHLGCKNALFLDGMLSEIYLPEQNWIQLDTNFGVMIGVTQPCIQ